MDQREVLKETTGTRTDEQLTRQWRGRGEESIQKSEKGAIRYNGVEIEGA